MIMVAVMVLNSCLKAILLSQQNIIFTSIDDYTSIAVCLGYNVIKSGSLFITIRRNGKKIQKASIEVQSADNPNEIYSMTSRLAASCLSSKVKLRSNEN